jgi:four helix bundle protein
MTKIRSHNDLKVYQESLDMVLSLYQLTATFPNDEKFGLTSQIRRAGISIPSNIAEGAARQSNKEFIRFLYISLGSAAEIETQLEIARRLGLIKNDINVTEKIIYIKRMLIKLIESLKRKGVKK